MGDNHESSLDFKYSLSYYSLNFHKTFDLICLVALKMLGKYEIIS